jgi:hypothetical protein
VLRALVLLAMLAGAVRGQAVTWRFTEVLAYGCPSHVGQPLIDPVQQRYPITSQWGAITITWNWFDANQPVLLLLGYGSPVPVWSPCITVPPDLVLVGTTTPWGWARFSWLVPATAPVPLGITALGCGQVVQLSWSGLIPSASSPPFTIEAMR